jgi:hypothetical protein
MAKAKSLTKGVDSPACSPAEENERIAVLRATVEKYLPAFVKAVATAAGNMEHAGDGPILLHQDAFAAGYDDDEFMLLGMAVKYAGLSGVRITVHGRNHETF